ncbi:hypothetical protein [Kordia zhangzhouensis]|uniref:hypothetical protein n=1 Tax=Kordia zhangzhouensis TaxID=1620405 RepID=UPI0012FA98A5|nr:hypothetical protein [Kordia zhangzhouensis]
MKKRELQQSLKLKKTTISTLSEKAIKGGTLSDIYTSRFVDLCYGVQTSYQGVCAIQCAPTEP